MRCWEFTESMNMNNNCRYQYQHHGCGFEREESVQNSYKIGESAKHIFYIFIMSANPKIKITNKNKENKDRYKGMLQGINTETITRRTLRDLLWHHLQSKSMLIKG